MYGLYCTISGNEPSSVALFKPATKARLLYCNFENLHETSKSKTHFLLSPIKIGVVKISPALC